MRRTPVKTLVKLPATLRMKIPLRQVMLQMAKPIQGRIPGQAIMVVTARLTHPATAEQLPNILRQKPDRPIILMRSKTEMRARQVPPGQKMMQAA